MRQRCALVLLLLMMMAATAHGANVILAWDQVLQNDDLSLITDLAGYRVYYGTTNGGPYPSMTDVGLTATPSTPQASIGGLTPTLTYYFVVRAYDSEAPVNESLNSNQIQITIPTATPIAYWFRTETGISTTATDLSGFGHTATLCEAATCPQQGPTWGAGPSGAVLECDGTNDNAQVAHAADLDITGDLTLSFWINLRGTATIVGPSEYAPAVIVKEEENSPYPAAWAIAIRNTAGTHQFEYYHHSAAGNFDAFPLFTAHTITLNVWQHIAFVRTLAIKTVRLYVNGVDTQALTWPTDQPQASLTPLRFCASGNREAVRYTNIDLGRVRLYAEALTPTEITALYQEVALLAPAVPTGGVLTP